MSLARATGHSICGKQKNPADRGVAVGDAVQVGLHRHCHVWRTAGRVDDTGNFELIQ
jgi:hypothetical protein